MWVIGEKGSGNIKIEEEINRKNFLQYKEVHVVKLHAPLIF